MEVKNIVVAVITVFMLGLNTVQAGQVVANIERISVGGWDSYYEFRTDSTYNPANCPNNPRYWFFEKTNEFRQAWLALAMTAYTAGKPVSAYIDNTECVNGYPKLRRLTLGGEW